MWIAVAVYVLVAILRKRHGSRSSLYEILQVLSVVLFEKAQLECALQPNNSRFEGGPSASS